MLPADRMRLFLRACTTQHKRLANGVLAKTCRGVHFCTRPAHPRPTSRRHLPNGTIKQSLRRPMTGEVDVGGRLAEDLHNLSTGTHPRPTLSPCPAVVALRHGVRYVETGRPLAISCQAPE